MNHQFQKVSDDLANWFNFEWDEAKIKCVLRHGLEVHWYYRDDVEFCNKFDGDPKLEAQYTGTIIAKPDIEGRSHNELAEGDCIVVITSYPCEKENPRTEYCALVRLLSDPDLVELFQEPSPVLEAQETPTASRENKTDVW